MVRVADEFVIDLMGLACGVDFAEAIKDAETIDVQGVPVVVAGPATVIRTLGPCRGRPKLASGADATRILEMMPLQGNPAQQHSRRALLRAYRSPQPVLDRRAYERRGVCQ